MGSCQGSQNFNDIVIPSDYDGMKVVCQTWKNTYNNLFDYSAERQNYEISFVNIHQSCLITKDNNNQIITKPVAQKSIEDIVKITLQNNNHFIIPSDNISKNPAHQLWLVIKSTPSKKYKIKEGDIVRIGKQKVKVKQIIIDEHEAEAPVQITAKYKIYDSLTKLNSQGYNYDKFQSNEDHPVCRVCLDEGQEDNPLIAPCKCSGSAKYIHIKCIQEWFNKTINPRTINSAIIISWKPLVCELCHQHLAFKIYLDGNKHFTVNIPRPKKPYIVLNPVEKGGGKVKIYYLVSFADKKKLSIGRKKDADIVMDQCTSISRYHSYIQYESQTKPGQRPRFLISDNDSKFGTLVLLKKPISFEPKFSGLRVQFGGNNLAFVIGKHRSIQKNRWQQSDELNDSESESQDQEDEQQDQNRE